MGLFTKHDLLAFARKDVFGMSELSGEVVHALDELNELLIDAESLDITLRRVADLAVRTISGCDGAGCTLTISGQPTTSGATEEWVLEIDKDQYIAGEGPCLEALEGGKVVLCEDISTETRWPDFVARSKERGLRSVLSFPLMTKNGPHGALNVYSKSPGAFGEEQQHVGDLLAKRAAVAVMNSNTYASAIRLVEHLKEALKTLEIIGEAKGILMAQEGVSPDEAFDMLKRASQTSNLKLRDIAQGLVTRVQGKRQRRSSHDSP